MWLLLQGALMLWAALWILKRAREWRDGPPVIPPPLPHETVAMHRSLDQQITQDALNREKRAKAGLVAVLQSQGCTAKQIAEVLKSVDNVEEGDLQ